MPESNPPDIRLVHLGVNLHLRQVLRDGKDRGRLQRRGHCLADIHIARHDDPVNGRPDYRVVQIDAGYRQGSGSLPHLSPRLRDAGGGGVERRRCSGVGRLRKVLLLLGHGTRGSQDRHAVIIRFRLHECGIRPLRVGLRRRDARLRALQVGRGLLQRSLEQGRIDQGDDVAPMHAGIEVRVELGDSPGHLRSDLHGRDRIDGSRGVHRVPDLAAPHRGGEVKRLAVVAQPCCHQEHDQPDRPRKQNRAEPPERDELAEPFLRAVHSYRSATMGSSRDALRAG